MAKVAPEVPGKDVSSAEDGPMARVLAVIETVAFAEQPVALKGVEEKTGLPKPTVHRILGQLERMGYLQRGVGPKSYFPGTRLAAMSLAALGNRWSHHESHKVLADLVARLGETCNITVLDGYEVLIVDRVETHWPLRFVMHVNSRFSLHNTSSGRLYLALMPRKRRAWYAANFPLTSTAPNTITDPRKLERVLEKIRKEGCSLDDEGLFPGLVAAAVPIFDSKRQMIGTVAVNASKSRVASSQIAAYVPMLREAAKAISAAHERA